MGRKIGSKNKKTKIITKTKNTNKNTNINNVHVHVEKPKTRKRRTTKPKEEPNNNPLSNSVNAISRKASSNLGFHPRGLINNEMQQPTIINIQPTAQVELLEKKLKKYKDKLNANKTAQDTTNQSLITQLTTTPQQPNITVSQPPINVNVNPFNPEVKNEKIDKSKTPLKKSVVRNIKSKTKAGTMFKPSELDETGSLASFIHSSRVGSRAPSIAYEPQQMEEIQLMETRAAKTAAQRLEAQHKRQTKEEKQLENRLYTLKGTSSKKGGIQLTEENLIRLNAELAAGPKAAKKKQIESSITRLSKALENMKIELPNIEEKLTAVRASRTPVKRGRPAGITSFVSNLFSPAK